MKMVKISGISSLIFKKIANLKEVDPLTSPMAGVN